MTPEDEKKEMIASWNDAVKALAEIKAGKPLNLVTWEEPEDYDPTEDIYGELDTPADDIEGEGFLCDCTFEAPDPVTGEWHTEPPF